MNSGLKLSREKEIKEDRRDISQRKIKKKFNKYWERLEEGEKKTLERKAKREATKYIQKMKKLLLKDVTQAYIIC